MPGLKKKLPRTWERPFTTKRGKTFPLSPSCMHNRGKGQELSCRGSTRVGYPDPCKPGNGSTLLPLPPVSSSACSRSGIAGDLPSARACHRQTELPVCHSLPRTGACPCAATLRNGHHSIHVGGGIRFRVSSSCSTQKGSPSVLFPQSSNEWQWLPQYLHYDGV